MKTAFSCQTKWGVIEINEFDYNFFELTLIDHRNWKLSGYKFSETQNRYIKEEIGEVPNMFLRKFINWAGDSTGKNMIKKIDVENNVKRLDLIGEFIDLLTGGI